MSTTTVLKYPTFQFTFSNNTNNNTSNTSNIMPMDPRLQFLVENDLLVAPHDASNDSQQEQQQRPQSLSRSQLSRSLINIPSRTSLIDNKLAQSLSLKRARNHHSDPQLRTAQLKIKKSNSDASITTTHNGAKYSYKNRTTQSSVTVKIVSQGSSGSTPSSPSSSPSPDQMCPYTFIESVLINNSCNDENDSPSSSSNNKQSMMQPLHATEFLNPTPEQIAAYSIDAIAAVRTSDITRLRAIHSEGQTLRCCNRFGESLLHVACRRSNASVVSFLLNEAGVSPRIKDDYGRTPLHDACWRGNPEYDIVELLLNAEPRLAFVQDVRGHKPFQYARREHWGAWKEFLEQKRELILI